MSSEIRSTQKRINDIVAIQGAYQTMQELHPIHDTWQKKNFKSARDRYRNEHSDELDRYRKAVGLLMKVNGSKTVDHAALRSEFQDLTDDNAVRNAELEAVKDELKQLRSIRYYVSKVIPEEAEPEKVSISDRLTDGRLHSDRTAAGQVPEQTEQKKNIEHSGTLRKEGARKGGSCNNLIVHTADAVFAASAFSYPLRLSPS